MLHIKCAFRCSGPRHGSDPEIRMAPLDLDSPAKRTVRLRGKLSSVDKAYNTKKNIYNGYNGLFFVWVSLKAGLQWTFQRVLLPGVQRTL